MRLDLFLKASRLVARRAVAQALCEAGQVLVNGAQAKSARVVRAGDEIELRRRKQILLIRVAALPATKQVARADARGLYEILSDVIVSEELFD